MLEWLKTILGDNYSEEVDKKISAEIGKNFVSRADFNTLNETKKALDGQIAERDRQLDELKKVDTASLQNEITRLQGENKTAKAKYDAEIAKIKLNSALDSAITAAGGKNAKAIKALLDVEKLKLKNDGTVEGLDLESVKKSDSYLFSVTETHQQGGDPQGSNSEPTVSEPPTDYSAYKKWREKNE